MSDVGLYVNFFLKEDYKIVSIYDISSCGIIYEQGYLIFKFLN